MIIPKTKFLQGKLVKKKILQALIREKNLGGKATCIGLRLLKVWDKGEKDNIKQCKSRLSLIARVHVVLSRTVVVDSDCQQHQSYSGQRSPGRSNSTYF